MVVAYVRLYPSLAPNASPTSRIYALLLPSAADSTEWSELSVRKSPLGGFGVYPRRAGKAAAQAWSNAGSVPVLLPYLGVETVVKDDHSRKTLISVLKGHFERVTLGELQARHGGGRAYVVDGLFAVPQSSPSQKPLPPATRLLQVAASGDVASACYMLEEDGRIALSLTGERAHLFDLLCAHAKHEHADRHLATHVASLHRKEEGYILINAHPAFADPVSVTGMINEPPSGQTPTTKMTQSYARFLSDDDPLMRQQKLTQPAGAEAAWREHILQPLGSAAEGSAAAAGDEDPWRCSERMVLYQTTRSAYPLEAELTVDYGKAYARDYASGCHRTACKPLYAVPPETYEFGAPANWPDLPGWFNPRRQPRRRPAFEVQKPGGGVRVCPDEPAVVAARRAALGESRGTEAQEAAGGRATGAPPVAAVLLAEEDEGGGTTTTPPRTPAKAKAGRADAEDAPSPTSILNPLTMPRPRPLRLAASSSSSSSVSSAATTGAKKRTRPPSPPPARAAGGMMATGLSGMFAARKRR